MSTAFKEIYQNSIRNPEEFWQKVSDDIFLVQKAKTNFK